MIDARSNRFNIGICHNKPFKVIACTITLVAFFVSTFSCDLAHAASITVNPVKSDNSDPTKILNLKTFTIPEDMGHVKEVCVGSGTKTVIQIQDAHCNYAAQNRVAEIIEYLNTEYGISAVNLEGGAKDYDLSIFTNIADKDVREKTADYFVREGLVNGAEYFAIKNPEKVSLWGVEEPVLYMENLKIYRDSLSHKDEIEKSLKSLSYILTNLKIKIYSKELLEFDTKYSQYKANNIEFKEYLDYIFSAAKEKAIDIKAFRNIALLNKSLREEAYIDFNKANNERDSLVDMLHKKLSRNSMEELVVKTVEFKTGKIPQKDFHAYLLDKAKKAGIDLTGISELQKYAAYIAAYDAIDKITVMDELDGLEAKIKDAMFENSYQKYLSALSKNLTLLKNMFDISLTRDDYRYYKASEDAFAMRNYTRFIDDNAPKYKISARPDENIGNIDRYRDEIAKFYDCSFKRDKAFVKNIKFNRQAAVSRGQANETAIIVTGGFHTDNLCEIFKKEGVSYISIVPVFKNDEGYQSPYFGILSGKKSGLVGQMRAAMSSISSMQVASMLSDAIAKEAWDKTGIDAFKASVALERMAREKDWEIDRIEPWGDSIVVHLSDGTTNEIILKELITGRSISAVRPRVYTQDNGWNEMTTRGLKELEELYPELDKKFKGLKKPGSKVPIEVLVIGPGRGFEILDMLRRYPDLNLKFSSVGLESFFNYSNHEGLIEQIQYKYHFGDKDAYEESKKDFEMLRDNFRHIDMDKGLTYRDVTNVDKDKTFDVIIFGSHVMDYSKDRISLIQEVYRILKPGGIGIVDLQPIVIGISADDVAHKMNNRNEEQEKADVTNYFKELGVPDEFDVEYSGNYPTLTIRKAENGNTVDMRLNRIGEEPADGSVSRHDSLQGYAKIPPPSVPQSSPKKKARAYERPGHDWMRNRGLKELEKLYPNLWDKLKSLDPGAKVLFVGPGEGNEILGILHDPKYVDAGLDLKFNSVGLENFFSDDNREKLIENIRREYYDNMDDRYERAREDFEMLRDNFRHADMDDRFRGVTDKSETYKDEDFDAVIFGSLVMPYSKDRISLVKEVYRILKPGGIALIDLQPMVIGGSTDDVKHKLKDRNWKREIDEATDYFRRLGETPDEFSIKHYGDFYPRLTIHKSKNRKIIAIPLSRVADPDDSKFLQGYEIIPAPPAPPRSAAKMSELDEAFDNSLKRELELEKLVELRRLAEYSNGVFSWIKYKEDLVDAVKAGNVRVGYLKIQNFGGEINAFADNIDDVDIGQHAFGNIVLEVVGEMLREELGKRLQLGDGLNIYNKGPTYYLIFTDATGKNGEIETAINDLLDDPDFKIAIVNEVKSRSKIEVQKLDRFTPENMNFYGGLSDIKVEPTHSTNDAVKIADELTVQAAEIAKHTQLTFSEFYKEMSGNINRLPPENIERIVGESRIARKTLVATYSEATHLSAINDMERGFGREFETIESSIEETYVEDDTLEKILQEYLKTILSGNFEEIKASRQKTVKKISVYGSKYLKKDALIFKWNSNFKAVINYIMQNNDSKRLNEDIRLTFRLGGDEYASLYWDSNTRVLKIYMVDGNNVGATSTFHGIEAGTAGLIWHTLGTMYSELKENNGLENLQAKLDSPESRDEIRKYFKDGNIMTPVNYSVIKRREKIMISEILTPRMYVLLDDSGNTHDISLEYSGNEIKVGYRDGGGIVTERIGNAIVSRAPPFYISKLDNNAFELNAYILGIPAEKYNELRKGLGIDINDDDFKTKNFMGRFYTPPAVSVGYMGIQTSEIRGKHFDIDFSVLVGRPDTQVELAKEKIKKYQLLNDGKIPPYSTIGIAPTFIATLETVPKSHLPEKKMTLTEADIAEGIIDLSRENETRQTGSAKPSVPQAGRFAKNYAPGKYRTTITVSEGAVTATKYNENGIVAGTERSLSEGESITVVGDVPKSTIIVRSPDNTATEYEVGAYVVTAHVFEGKVLVTTHSEDGTVADEISLTDGQSASIAGRIVDSPATEDYLKDLTNRAEALKKLSSASDTISPPAVSAVAEMEATLEDKIMASKAIIKDINGGTADIIVMPGSDIYLPKQATVNRDTARRLSKEYGQDTVPYSYKFGDDWMKNLTEGRVLSNAMSELQDRINSGDNTARAIIFVPFEGVAAVKDFMQKTYPQLAESVSVVGETDIPSSGMIDNVMHIVLGKGLLNYSRHSKDMTMDSQKILADLIKVLVSDPQAIDLARDPNVINNILNGLVPLKIKPIDFKEIDEWKKTQDALLTSL